MPEVDGVKVCCDCEEVIPGGEWYYEIDGRCYCESCMYEHKHVAPYFGEEF